jgi:predicted ArsR family transcriptional regulator
MDNFTTRSKARKQYASGPTLFDTRSDSIRALNKSDNLDIQWNRLKAALRRIQPASRQQLAKELGWETSSVCGRVNELMAAQEIVECGVRTGETGRKQKLLRLR